MVSLKTLSLASLYQLAAVAAASLVAMWRWPDGLSGILLGGMVMSVNFAAARALAAKMLTSKNNRAVYALGLGMKFVLLLAIVAAILMTMQPNLLAFGLGLGTFFVGVAVAVLHQGWDARQAAGNPST